MNKNVKILIAVLALIIIGAGGFVLFKNSSQKPTGQQISSDQNQSTGKSIKDLLTSGQSQMCTFTDKVEGSESSGTAYVSGGRVRVDATSSSNGQTLASHIILKDNKMYSWMDNQSMGYMMEFDPNKMMDNSSSSADSASSQNVDINKYVDYKCSAWTADESKFSEPSNIKFQSMGGVMMKPTGTSSSTGNSAPPQYNCSTCDQLPSAAAAECKKALKCS